MEWLINIIKEWLRLYLKGMIVLWSGAIVDIPDGWHLCDGDEGTPDLRNRFIIAAGDTYAPNNTGGTNAHDHAGYAIGHKHSAGDHTHTIDGHQHTHDHPITLSGSPIGTVGVAENGEPVGHDEHTHYTDIPPITSSSEPLTSNEGTGDTGEAATGLNIGIANHVPKYYALAYIMKL